MKKTKRVTIIGFPNVGKSTLFNRLAGARKSLVHSLPGMTRDAVTALVRVGDRTFELVDTGGFFGAADEPFSAKVREKAWQEASRSDLVLLVVDGRRGLLPGEEELFTDLKKSGKKLLVVINKVDTSALDPAAPAGGYRRTHQRRQVFPGEPVVRGGTVDRQRSPGNDPGQHGCSHLPPGESLPAGGYGRPAQAGPNPG
jgi:small GTP-binding protein